MRDEDIHIGDVLRIRDWDDMASEYTVSPDLGIKLTDNEVYFANGMRRLCGELFTVVKKEFFLGICRYHSYENVEGNRNRSVGGWTITANMLEPYPNDDVVSDEDFAPLPIELLAQYLKD